jgi:signal transduction histidine kinase
MAFRMLQRGQVAMQGHTADVVERNHRRMDVLIEQTLTAVRAQSEAKPPLHELALAPMLQEVTTGAVPERGIRVTVEADESLHVIADEHLLSSAISNLVQNAIKLSHDDANIVLRARRDEGAVAVEVEDECGGLPEGKSEDLFKPFVQRGEDKRGVGLGLAITRDAVHALAGEISVRNRPGRGCTFVVRLPSPQ